MRFVSQSIKLYKAVYDNLMPVLSRSSGGFRVERIDFSRPWSLRNMCISFPGGMVTSWGKFYLKDRPYIGLSVTPSPFLDLTRPKRFHLTNHLCILLDFENGKMQSYPSLKTSILRQRVMSCLVGKIGLVMFSVLKWSTRWHFNVKTMCSNVSIPGQLPHIAARNNWS